MKPLARGRGANKWQDQGLSLVLAGVQSQGSPPCPHVPCVSGHMHVVSDQERMKHERRGFSHWAVQRPIFQGRGDARPHITFQVTSNSRALGSSLAPGLKSTLTRLQLKRKQPSICPDAFRDRKLYESGDSAQGKERGACQLPLSRSCSQRLHRWEWFPTSRLEGSTL